MPIFQLYPLGICLTLIFLGPPDSVENCSVTNQTEDSMIVECSPGYDGGLQQQFVLEVHETALHRLQVNLSASSYPYFQVHGIPSGTHFLAIVYAANAKGRSQAVVMRTHTLPGPESQTRREPNFLLLFYDKNILGKYLILIRIKSRAWSVRDCNIGSKVQYRYSVFFRS
ncbi:UNVERIFIED_CONTAM: hypothetical protein NCL1_07510 [Trichonephila clavipes]